MHAQRTTSTRLLILLSAVLGLVPQLGGLVKGEFVCAPLKLLFYFEPWRATPHAFEKTAWDVLIWDGVAQFYVWRDMVRSMWLSGEAPLWNPYALCGTPLLANSQSAPFYPPHLLASPLPTWAAMGVLAWFHLFWASLGLGLWLRKRGLNPVSVWVGMTVWALSLFMLAWLPLSSVPATLSWFGWLLLGLEVVRERGGRGAWAFALPMGLMLLAGHLQFAFYGLLMSLLYALYQGYPIRASGRWKGYMLALGVAYLLGGLLAAIQILPTLELAGYSHRQAAPTEAGYQAYVRNALPLFHLITAWFPNAYGNLRAGDYWGAVHYAELALYVGPFGLLFALMGVRRRGQGAFWLGIGLLALLIALGTPLTKLLYFYFPGYSATGSPARILCLWAFSMAILAAYGCQETSVWKRAFAVWIILLAIAWLLMEQTLPTGVSREQVLSGVLNDLVGYLLLTALFGVGVLAQRAGVLANRPVSYPLLLVLVPLIVAANLPRSAPLRAVYPPLLERPTLGLGERVAVLNTRWSLYEPPPARMPPNTPVAYRLYDVGGYDSLLPRHYKRFLDILNGQDSAPPENGNMLFVKVWNPALMYLRVKAVLTPDGWMRLNPAPARLQPLELLPDEETVWARLQMNPFPDAIPVYGEAAQRAAQQYGRGVQVDNLTLEWQAYRATYLRLRVVNPTNQTSWLLIADTWYPGWSATVNARSVPMLQANGAFRAVPIPAGEAIVEMRFLPRSFMIGALLSAIGLIGVGMLFGARNLDRVSPSPLSCSSPDVR